MQNYVSTSRTWRLGLLLIAGLTLIALAIPEFFQKTQAAEGDLPSVTYSHGIVRADIPYRSPHFGPGRLLVEIVDPENRVIGRAENRAEVSGGKGSWHEEVKLAHAIALDDLVWHRLRYRFGYEEGTEVLEDAYSVSQILRMPVMHILGQQSYLTGGEAAVRVIVTDSRNDVVSGPSSLRIYSQPGDDKANANGDADALLFTGAMNSRGTTEAQFRFPSELAGTYALHYVVDTPIGSTEFTQPVRLEEKAAILLTSEKPFYQPGQTIHVRALALNRADHDASAGRKLTFEIEDSRANKVFKKATQTDRFGIASAEFTLADEVNLGTYHLRAVLNERGDELSTNAASTAEIALNVERYVLPKFKVAVDLTAKENTAKHGYRPGDHVKGTVRANYFFGKPVDGAEITVKASAADVTQFDAGSVEGKTDADGAYHFDIKLPGYFVGRSFYRGTARVLIEATVKDSAGHSETRGEPITVSESPLIVTAIPEGGTLIPNLENQIFIVASYIDGKPARANIAIHAAGKPDQDVTTDEGGIAIARLRAGAGTKTLHIEANDKEGNHTSTSLDLSVREGADQILLRPERAVYRAGERIQFTVFSTKTRGNAYVDVVKEGQTIVTRDVELKNGQGQFVLTATPDLAGTLDVQAYLFGRDARPIGDHRLVFVQPADELKIEASTDAHAYKPGDDARISFRVTDARGAGVQAALGLQVVDEAVFALSEKQPGFAKVFFYLEQEALRPRYEIHSIGMPEIVEPVEAAKIQQKDRAARALFSATEMVNPNSFETEFGRAVPVNKFWEYAGRYHAAFVAQSRRLATSLTSTYAENSTAGELPVVFAKVSGPDRRDAWATMLRLERVAWDPQKQFYMLRSAGPDKRFGTGDDLSTYLQTRADKVVQRQTFTPTTIGIKVEHGRGAFNGLGEIVGSAVDQTGSAIPGARVNIRDGGNTRTTVTDAEGNFRFAGLPPGDYEVEISRPGFRTASDDVTLQARDQAILSATLTVGSVAETVTVQASTAQIRVGGRADGTHLGAGFGGGALRIGGGIPGGIDGNLQDLPLNGRNVSSVITLASAKVNTGSLAKAEPAAATPRVRSYFPEALFINPAIITDQNGRASISIPLADSITTWRMAMLASTTRGALGSGTSSIKVFQDFFVDLDMPVTLTQGDRVSIPVGVYNYSGTAGDVSLQLKSNDWFSLVDDVPSKAVTVESGRVGGSQFTLEAKRIGKFKLTLAARMTGATKAATGADIVVREIEVIPNGREQNLVFNGRLESEVHHALNFPANSIPDASKIFVRLYPGPLSQIIEGMDSLLRMPGGCFEQTSSSTYPNVLALDYMARTKKLTPEVHAKAEGFIANGYQRLLTFEVPGGGFSWFGNAPANKILTAYGLMEFFDMSKVHDVDPKLIARTQQWLTSQQQADGSWKPDSNFINEGATNRYNSDLVRITAYIAWALENSWYKGPGVEKAKQFLEKHLGEKTDAYTLAVLANFAADYEKDREFTRRATQQLLDARTEKDEQAWWTSAETGVYATGDSANAETTGLAVQALLKSGADSSTASKALRYIASKKDASGTWGTTQATILALRALLLSTEKGSADVRGAVEISLNGKPVQRLVLTPENNDLLHQFIFPANDAAGGNKVDVRIEGQGGLAYQVVGRHFVPWDEKPDNEPLSIEVSYNRTHLMQDDIATATATVKNNLSKPANMVMVDLGIPPGFDLLSEDLQAYREKTAAQKSGRLEKFNLTATQAILYFDSLAPGSIVTLPFRLRAKYPIRARTFQSRVYEYYDPDVNSVARPTELEVRKR